MVWILLIAGCASCLQLPNDVDDPNDDPPTGVEDSGDGDSGDDTDTAEDTGPAVIPMCTLEEVEDDDPSNDFSELLYVPLSTYACGEVNTKGDVDYLTFTTTMPGWMKVDVQAASRGSSADMFDILSQTAEDESVEQHDRHDSTDPLSVFYAEKAGDYLATLAEAQGGFGEPYPWWFIAMPTKEPFSYHMLEGVLSNDPALTESPVSPVDEIEPNNTVETATVLTANVPIFAKIGTRGDSDWYTFSIPEATTTLTYEVDAFDFGSAADMSLEIYYAYDGAEELFIVSDGRDDRDGGADPWFELDLVASRELWEGEIAKDPEGYPGTPDFNTLNIRAHHSDENVGSMFYWYTLWITISSEEK